MLNKMRCRKREWDEIQFNECEDEKCDEYPNCAVRHFNRSPRQLANPESTDQSSDGRIASMSPRQVPLSLLVEQLLSDRRTVLSHDDV